MTRTLLALCALMAFALPAHAVTAAGTADANGLQTLTINGGANLITSDSFDVYDATFIRNSDGTTYNPGTGSTGSSFNSTTKTLTRTYPWGSISVARPITNAGGIGKMAYTLTVTNTTSGANAATMTKLDINAFKIAMGGSPTDDPNPTYPLLKFGDEDPPALPLTGPNYRMVVVNTDPSKKMGIALFEDGTTNEFTFRLSMHKQNWFPENVKTIAATTTIPAGTSVTFPLEFRFADTNIATMTQAGTGTSGIADDVRDAWLAIYPPRLNWPDGRPLCQVIMSTSVTQHPNPSLFATNPRGWIAIGEPNTVDVTTSAGLADFRTRMLAALQTTINVCKSNKGQGLVFVDPEGQEFQHSDLVGNTNLASLIGDPNQVEIFAPEMAYVGTSNPSNPGNKKLFDEMMDLVKANGLKFGFTFRPQDVSLTSTNPRAAYQALSSNPTVTMTNKISAAKTRWGANDMVYIYIDSNGSPGTNFDPQMVESLLTTFPNILLIPEHEATREYQVSAPYNESHLAGQYRVPQAVYDLNPKARMVQYAVIDTITGNSPEAIAKRVQLAAGVAAGDIMYFRSWYPDEPNNSTIQDIYTAADSSAPTVTTRTPAPSATGIAVGSNIVINFNEVVIPASINSTTVQVKQGATIIPATLSQSTDWLTLTINPNADLAAGGTYTVTLKGGAEGILDSHGNALATDVTWSFSTVSGGGTTVYLRSGSHDRVTFIEGVANSPTAGRIRLTMPTGHTYTTALEKVNVWRVRGCKMATGTRTVEANGANWVDVTGRNREALTCESAATNTFNHATVTEPAKFDFATIAPLTARILKPAPSVDGLDGPTGTQTLALATKDVTGWKPWESVLFLANADLNDYPLYAYDATTARRALATALAWKAKGSPLCAAASETDTNSDGRSECNDSALTTQQKADWLYYAAARNYIRHFEKITGGFGCHPGISDCGWGSSSMTDMANHYRYIALTFSLLSPYLSNGDRDTFLAKATNQAARHNAQIPCENSLVEGVGSITIARIGTTQFSSVTFSDPSQVAQFYANPVRGGGDTLRFSPAQAYTKPLWVLEKNNTASAVGDLPPYSLRVQLEGSWSLGVKTTWGRARAWAPGQCGFIWFSTQESTNPLNSPSESLNLSTNLSQTLLSVAQAGCPYSEAACMEMEEQQASWYDRFHRWAKEEWPGFSTNTVSHYRSRQERPIAWNAVGLRAGIENSDGLWPTEYIKNNLHAMILTLLPDETWFGMQWQEAGDTDMLPDTMTSIASGSAALGLDSTEAKRLKSWMETRWGGWDRQHNPEVDFPVFAYVFLDPNADSVDYKTTPLQLGAIDTAMDTLPGAQYGYIQSLTDWTDRATMMNFGGITHLVDHSIRRNLGQTRIYKRGYLLSDGRAAGRSTCMVKGGACWQGAVPNESLHMNVGQRSNKTGDTAWGGVSVGDRFRYVGGNAFSQNALHWLGFSGPRPQGRSEYVWGDYEAAEMYDEAEAVVTKARYRFLHIKAPGTLGGEPVGRDLLIRHNYLATPVAQWVRTRLVFPNNGGNGEGPTTLASPGVWRTATGAGYDTSMHAHVLLPSTVDWTNVQAVTSGSTITINPQATAQTPSYHKRGGKDCTWTAPIVLTRTGAAETAQLYLSLQSDCKFHVAYALTTGAAAVGVITANPSTEAVVTGGAAYGAGNDALYNFAVTNSTVFSSGPYEPWNGGQAIGEADTTVQRVEYDLAKPATSAEFLVAFEVHDNTTATPSAVTASVSGEDRTVTIGGDLPAVVTLSRTGVCRTSWSKTVSFTGTAYFVAADLCTGSYTLTRPGGATENVIVNAGDNTAGWSGTQGAYTLSQGGTPPATVSVSPTSVSFGTFTRGGSVPGNQTLTLTISGGTSPSCTMTSSQPWLTVSPGIRTTSGTVTLSLVAAQLASIAAGNRTANVQYACADATAPASTPVSLTVAEVSQVITATPNPLVMTMRVGDVLPEGTVTVSVSSGTKTGTATVSGPFTIGENANWTATVTGVGIPIQPNPLAMVPGLNTGTLTITPSGMAAITVLISFTYEADSEGSLLVLQRSSDGVRVQVPCSINGETVTIYASLNANLYPVIASKTGRCQYGRAIMVLSNLSAAASIHLFGSAGSLASDGSVITRAVGAAGVATLRSSLNRLTHRQATQARLRYCEASQDGCDEAIKSPGGGTAGTAVACSAGCAPTIPNQQLYKGYWTRLEQLDAGGNVVRRETPVYVSAGQ